MKYVMHQASISILLLELESAEGSLYITSFDVTTYRAQ